MASDVIKGLGYLSVGVSSLDEAVEFYSRFVRLELTEQIGRTAFMTGGLEHHWIRLEEGNGQGVRRVAYEAVGEEGLLEVRSRLQQQGVQFEEGGDPSAERVQRWLRFVDPGGMNVEIYAGMWERGVAPVGSGVTMESFLHAGWETPNWDDSAAFYQGVLGFKPSDWIADRVGFFRAGNGYHHSLVMIRSSRPAFNHFCIQVESIDDVMRFRNNALKGGVALRDDLLRHAPSGSIGVYMQDEARGFSVEYCIGHPVIDDATHHPRILPTRPETKDVWLSPLPDRGQAAREQRPGPVVATSSWIDSSPGTGASADAEKQGSVGHQLVR
jgi:2,3-dihydroxy-p-cumate/2,3-dihydroxybenzoate 3,4-dioxygenase